MSSLSFQSLDANVDFRPEDLDVLAAITEYASILGRFGVSARVSTPTSEALLKTLPFEKKQFLSQYFRLNSQWMNAEIQSGLEKDGQIRIDRKLESRIAKRAMDHYGLKVSDRFWNSLEDDDLIEIYSTDMIQLYRSFGFFKLCGYSILEVSTQEWYHLWDRPSSIFREMLRVAKLAMTTYVEFAPYDVPRHILRESQTMNPKESYVPRACMVDFKFFASAMREGESAPAAGIASSRGEVIALGDDAHSIQFV